MGNPGKYQYRIYSLSGIVGGILLFAGDMLLYYNGEKTDLLQNMAMVSSERIVYSGVTALWATWAYLVGLIPVYRAFRNTPVWVRNTVLVTFAGILTGYGVVHGAYTAIATDAKLAFLHQLDIHDSINLSRRVNDSIRLSLYPLFAVLSVLFVYYVLKNKTLYPKWVVIFFPLFPLLFRDFICSLLSDKWWVIVQGGFYNLILVVFFTISAVVLWNKYE